MGTQTASTVHGDNLGRLLALLEAARAEEAARPRVDFWTASRMLLEAIEETDRVDRAA